MKNKINISLMVHSRLIKMRVIKIKIKFVYPLLLKCAEHGKFNQKRKPWPNIK